MMGNRSDSEIKPGQTIEKKDKCLEDSTEQQEIQEIKINKGEKENEIKQ